MVKPRLPEDWERRLPLDVRRYLYRFVPHLPKAKSPLNGLQRELERLQQSPKRTPMDLKGLDDFVLS
jgi:hypothetical protein